MALLSTHKTNHESVSTNQDSLSTNSLEDSEDFDEKEANIDWSKCSTCTRVFDGATDGEIMLEHKSYHLKLSSFECPFCFKPYTSLMKMLKHKSSHAKMKKKYACHICKKTFSFYKLLIFHFHATEHRKPESLRKAEDDEVVEDELYNSEIDMRNRIAKSQVDDSSGSTKRTDKKEIFLQIEDEKSQGEALKTKERIQIKKPRIRESFELNFTPYICEICMKKFGSFSQYEEHKKQHVSGRKHECEFCFDGFDTKERMLEHRGKHLGKYDCNICDNQFEVYHKFILHLIRERHHPKFYRTPILLSSTDKDSQLSTKCESKVDKEASMSDQPSSVGCSICFRKVLTPVKLKYHKSLHTSGFKFECSFCFTGFNDMDQQTQTSNT
jgi:KRAB domain-containing zinc finger protein